MGLAGKKRKIFDGRYEILSIVGRGACSVVYHARHAVAPASEVALKVLLNEKDQKASGEKLRKEALAMVSSRHKYVVRLDDFHSVGELCYLSMEYAPESDLRRYAAKSGGKLNPVQAELFLLQLSEALAFIHRAGIVHRDIKPDNILVINPKEIRLADFGVALLPGDKSSLAELQKGVGTMDYMAPEVLEGKTYDLQSDIYAMGVTFYELLSGKHPFANAPLVEQLNVRRDGKFPHLRDIAPQVPSYLASVIMQAMSYEPSARFPSTKELAQALLVHRPKPADARAKPTSSPSTQAAASVPSAAGPQTSPAPATSSAAPSSAVLAAIKAAAAQGKKPASSAASAESAKPKSPLAAPPASSNPAQAQAARQSMIRADSPEARREAARALLGKPSGARPPSAAQPSQPASASPAPPLHTKVEVTPDSQSPAAVKPESSAPAPASSGTPVAKATEPPPSPARAAPARDVAPTQVISAEKVAEVTAAAKGGGGSLLSRAFDSSDAVSKPAQTAPERRPNGEVSTQQNLALAAKDAFAKKEMPAPRADADHKKATQLITRDLVSHVRHNAKDAPKKTNLIDPKKHKPEVEETVVLKPEDVAKARKPKAERSKPAAAGDIWRKDPKKSRYMALSMGVLLVILWFGNIFLIKNYNIGVGKSLLGYGDTYASPIPRYAGEALAFPAVPSGLYTGTVTNLLGGRQAPLTFISFGEQKKLTVIVGIEGWTPAVVSVDPAAKAEGEQQPLRIVSNGIVLNMTGEAGDGELRGVFQDVITGELSEWRAKPVL